VVPSLLLSVAAFVCVLPLIWLVCASLKSGEDLFQYPLLPWGHLNRLSISNYTRLFADRPFGAWMLSSIFLCIHADHRVGGPRQSRWICGGKVPFPGPAFYPGDAAQRDAAAVSGAAAQAAMN